jgi:hypothetical protein
MVMSYAFSCRKTISTTRARAHIVVDGKSRQFCDLLHQFGRKAFGGAQLDAVLAKRSPVRIKFHGRLPVNIGVRTV